MHTNLQAQINKRVTVFKERFRSSFDLLTDSHAFRVARIFFSLSLGFYKDGICVTCRVKPPFYLRLLTTHFLPSFFIWYFSLFLSSLLPSSPLFFFSFFISIKVFFLASHLSLLSFLSSFLTFYRSVWFSLLFFFLIPSL